jgi:hypothetical protein
MGSGGVRRGRERKETAARMGRPDRVWKGKLAMFAGGEWSVRGGERR